MIDFLWWLGTHAWFFIWMIFALLGLSVFFIKPHMPKMTCDHDWEELDDQPFREITTLHCRECGDMWSCHPVTAQTLTKKA